MSKLLLGIVIALLCSPAIAERKYSDWGPPENLGCVTNSPSNDQGPAVSKDGLSLYFGSSRASPDAIGGQDLYVAQRASPSEAWGPARNLGPSVNSPEIDNIPNLSRDGHLLFFNSSRPGGHGDVDLWVAYRDHVHDDFAWQAPSNLGQGVNSAGFDAGAGYFENDGGNPMLFFGRGVAQTNQPTTDIYVAELQPDGKFGNAQPVPELNTPQGDQRPSVRYDGLEIFFYSERPHPTAVGGSDIWVATRETVNDSWSEPKNLGPVVNTASNETTPHISADGLTLYFASSRPGGCGANDLYVTRRTKLRGKD